MRRKQTAAMIAIIVGHRPTIAVCYGDLHPELSIDGLTELCIILYIMSYGPTWVLTVQIVKQKCTGNIVNYISSKEKKLNTNKKVKVKKTTRVKEKSIHAYTVDKKVTGN